MHDYADLKFFTDEPLCLLLLYGCSQTYLFVKMGNPLKNWFFELIEDAIGKKAMNQFKKEEQKLNSKQKEQTNKN